MKFRLVGQIYVYSIENWILVSYQAPKQRPRSCQKDMVQCPKNTVLKLKVTTGWFSMVFQLFHGPGIPVWSPIPEQQHRAVGRRAVLRSSSCLRPGRAAWHGFGRDQPPRETSWNMVFSCFFTLLSLSLPPSVFHPCITRRFRRHVQTCWDLHFHPFSSHKKQFLLGQTLVNLGCSLGFPIPHLGRSTPPGHPGRDALSRSTA